MTVHASKGLEAPVVFLVDSGSKAFVSSHVPKFRLLRVGAQDVPAWVPGSGLSNALTQADDARLKTSTEEEYRRLLYVGMTRAADHLVVCGYRGVRENPETWQQMIASALALDGERATATTFTGPGDEWQGLTWRMPFVPKKSRASSESLMAPGKTSAMVTRRPRPVRRRLRRLAKGLRSMAGPLHPLATGLALPCPRPLRPLRPRLTPPCPLRSSGRYRRRSRCRGRSARPAPA